jgi:RNA polymerase sigma-70 factor (ECF subfamily)
MNNFLFDTLQNYNDQSLINLWQQGNEQAFDVLYKRYVIQLVGLITQKTGSEENAKELSQDVFLAVYLQKDNLQNIQNFKAYLFGIAKNKVFNYYRHQLVKRQYQQNLLNEINPVIDDVNEILENKQLVQIIDQQVEQLPPKCREVFKLSRQENLSYKAIAQRLKISENTVDQHIQKALRAIRSSIKDYHR